MQILLNIKTNIAISVPNGTGDTLYTVPASTTTVVIGLTLCNIHTNLSLHL